MSNKLQPNREYRIVLLKKCEEGAYYSKSRCSYTVHITDVARPGSIVDSLLFSSGTSKRVAQYVAWTSENDIRAIPDKRLTRNEDSMARATKHAKEQAELLGLPFDQKTDIHIDQDFRQGPHQPCLICGTPRQHRSRDAYVCTECSEGARIQRSAARSETKQILVPYDNLVHEAYKCSEPVVNAIAAVLRQPVIAGHAYSTPVQLESHYNSSNGSRGALMHLGEDQIEAMKALLQAIHDATEASYREGVRQTDSILVSVATGRETLAVYDERIKRSIGDMQTR